MKKVLSILISATVLFFAIPAMSADKVVVIPLNSSGAPTKLWGEGREGTNTNIYTTANGINIARSVGLASWDGAAAVCPKNTWVCSAAEVSNLNRDRLTSTVTALDCAGNTTSLPHTWVRDESNSMNGIASYLYDGASIGLPGIYIYTASSRPKCYYLPVWCCSVAN